MQRSIRPFSRLSCIVILMGMLIFGSITPVSADNVLVTLGVLPGLLTETAVIGTVVAASPGAIANYTLVITATDTRGGTPSAGWNLTITSTPFHPLAGADFPSSASQVVSVSTPACVPLVCTSPTNNVAFPVAVPAATVPPAAVKFYNATAGSGTGVMVITPTVDVTIPSTALNLAYTSTVTLSIATGP